MPREAEFQAIARELGYDFNGEIKIGGNYTPTVRHGSDVYVSGQIPRVGNEVVVTGRAGGDVPLAEAQRAARICAMRALALLRQTLGSLDHVTRLLRITVYVRSAEGFTQQSEVADAASDLLVRVLQEAGGHTRTSVGVLELPKGATVEIDLIASAL
ncbi:RidA family protein [Acidovorax sp. GBBC 3334]|uniref:RidA family protein n=1 Tax=Acidovorax sp. GBBC 3334 TaxID=2940496 RepID=UPI002304D07D|nr:RidA family protein [Acidovorax sp. GBBC 3334]MDA8454922.1 RidA family protein [Acidovorax sp. GBBC 3334]